MIPIVSRALPVWINEAPAATNSAAPAMFCQIGGCRFATPCQSSTNAMMRPGTAAAIPSVNRMPPVTRRLAGNDPDGRVIASSGLRFGERPHEPRRDQRNHAEHADDIAPQL